MTAAPPEAVCEAARDWLRAADDDIRVARLCLKDDPPIVGNAAWHCQQAAEKLLKGLLLLAAIPFRKTHDLHRLMAQARVALPQLADAMARVADLTPWVAIGRYPAEDEQPSPPEVTDIEAALVDIAELREQVADLIDKR